MHRGGGSVKAGGKKVYRAAAGCSNRRSSGLGVGVG